MHNNTIANSKIGLNIEDIGPDNQIYSNTVVNATEKAIDIEEVSANASNIFDKNEVISFESAEGGEGDEAKR